MSIQAIILDVETHAKDNPEVVETAWMETGMRESAYLPNGNLRYPPTIQMWCPSQPITLGAMAVHHITDEDVADCPPSSFFELPACEFLIGHNIDYDAGAARIMENDPKRIDTCALARAVWPDIDTYSQGALIYHLDRENAKQRLKGAHGAGCDILLCKTILDAEIEHLQPTSWQHLWEMSEEARIPKTMYWGKHAGEKIEDLPADYKHWLLTKCNNPPIDKYLRRALTGEDRQRTMFCPK
jgi:exodeoxyribonuclease X